MHAPTNVQDLLRVTQGSGMRKEIAKNTVTDGIVMLSNKSEIQMSVASTRVTVLHITGHFLI